MANFDVRKLKDALREKFEELGLADADVGELLDDEHKFGIMLDNNPSFVEYLQEENEDEPDKPHLDSTGMNTVPVENIIEALR